MVATRVIVIGEVALQPGRDRSPGHVVADLVAVTTNSRTDPGQQLAGAAAGLPDQPSHRPRQDTRDGAAPTAMDDGDHLLERLIEDHRETVGGGDQEGPGFFAD